MRIRSHWGLGAQAQTSPFLSPVEFDFSQGGFQVLPAGAEFDKYPTRARKSVHLVTSESNAKGVFHVVGDTLLVEPQTFSEAVNSPESDKWWEAMKEERFCL
jgi:hypothetical protein